MRIWWKAEICAHTINFDYKLYHFFFSSKDFNLLVSGIVGILFLAFDLSKDCSLLIGK